MFLPIFNILYSAFFVFLEMRYTNVQLWLLLLLRVSLVARSVQQEHERALESVFFLECVSWPPSGLQISVERGRRVGGKQHRKRRVNRRWAEVENNRSSSRRLHKRPPKRASARQRIEAAAGWFRRTITIGELAACTRLSIPLMCCCCCCCGSAERARLRRSPSLDPIWAPGRHLGFTQIT